MPTEKHMRRAVCDWLTGQGLTPVFEVFMGPHTCDFIGVEFDSRNGRRIPPTKRTMAIELKLDDVSGVIKQCKNCLHAVSIAYAAMPASRCLRMRDETIGKFMNAGIGLLSVDIAVEQILAPLARTPPASWRRDTLARRLWKRRNEWVDRLARWEAQHAPQI